MANGHGGYRQPSKPAAVSGPGAHSQRTDGRPQAMDLPDAKYGEAAQFQEIQQGAPLGASGPGAGAGATPQQAPVGLGEGTQMPGVPVTAGADAGAGPGSAALGLPNTSDERAQLARQYGALLPYLIRKADDPSSSQDFRDQVRYLISRL